MNKLKQLVAGLIAMCLVIIPFAAQSSTVNAAQTPTVSYQAHVQNVGWQSYVKDGALAGTSGKGLRVESFRMNLTNSPVSGDIEYATHVQNIGWQAPRTSNQISGTTSQSLRMEAMRINLTGEIAKQYDVYYRTHVQNFGWLGWSKNGENAGSQGYGFRMEAIEIKLVKKGDKTPQTSGGFVAYGSTPSVNYLAHVQNIGWQASVADGALSGTSGKGLRVESFQMNLSNLPVLGDIEYATHIQNIGWQATRTSNQISGTTGQGLRMEAMRINLTGEIAKQYDVYYRTHVQNIGWMNWVKNGEVAGTSGRSLRMEAIEIKLVKKSPLWEEITIPYQVTEKYTEKVPTIVKTPYTEKEAYTVKESYTEKEAYTVREEQFIDVSYSDNEYYIKLKDGSTKALGRQLAPIYSWSQMIDISINESIDGKVYTRKIVYLVQKESNGFDTVTKYRDVVKERDVVKYRDVTKYKETITGYTDVVKTREVTKYRTQYRNLKTGVIVTKKPSDFV